MSISNIDKIREKVEKLKKLADAMYYAAQYLTTDASRLHKAMDEYHKFIIHEYFNEEPVSKVYTFKSIPRLLDMIQPSDRAKTYIAKLADSLDEQGYHTDANIVRESIKIMNGEKVAMATMDEEPISEDLEEAASRYAKEEYDHKSPATLPDRCRGCYAPLMYAFKTGAKWQKEQLELSWEDMHTIAIIEDKLIHELCIDDQTLPQTQEFYQEVLKRFKERKDGSKG